MPETSEAFEELWTSITRVIDGLPGVKDRLTRANAEHTMLCSAALEAADVLLQGDGPRIVAIDLIRDAAARAREIAAEMVSNDPRLAPALEWADRRAGGSDEPIPAGLLDFPRCGPNLG